MTPDETIHLAVGAATFFRVLVKRGIPEDRATSMTAAWIASQVAVQRIGGQEPPKEPWQE